MPFEGIVVPFRSKRGGSDIIARPASVSIITAFFILATIIAEVVSLSLMFPGTPIDNLWKLNDRAYVEFGSIGSSVVAIFLFALGIVMAFASWGFRHAKLWAWWTAVSIILLNGVGDLLSIVIRSDLLKGGCGIAVAGALLLMLFHAKTQAFFTSGDRPEMRATGTRA